MENKHTKGNWEVEYCLDQSIFINAGEIPVAMIQSEEDEGITPEMEANAKLIAAAPELLEALKKCQYQLSTWIESDSWTMEDEKADLEAQAAIEKATL